MSWTGCYIQQRGTCQNSDPFLSRTGLAAYRTNSIQKHFISWSYYCRSTSKKNNKPFQVHFTIPQNIDLHIHLRPHLSLTYHHTNHIISQNAPNANHHHQRVPHHSSVRRGSSGIDSGGYLFRFGFLWNVNLHLHCYHRLGKSTQGFQAATRGWTNGWVGSWGGSWKRCVVPKSGVSCKDRLFFACCLRDVRVS